MKNVAIACVVLIAGALLLQACGPSVTPEPPTPTATTQPSPTPTTQPSPTPTSTATPTPAPTETPPASPATPPELDMLTWLTEHRFIAVSEDFRDTVRTCQFAPPAAVDDLPEGFNVNDATCYGSEAADGEAFLATTTYQFPFGDQTLLEHYVSVVVVAYSNEAVREWHFGILAINREALLVEFGEFEVLSFHDQTAVGHIWISGPFAIIVTSASPPDGSPNAWLSIFSEILLDVYPPQTN